MLPAPLWSSRLAPHISLTAHQIEGLERVRDAYSLPDDIFRLNVEQWPPFREAWFAAVYTNVVALSPDMTDLYYAARVAYEFSLMRRATYDFIRAAEAARADGDPLPPLRILRAPTAPPPPSPEELTELLDMVRSLDTVTVASFAAHIARVEADERAAETDPRMRALTDAIFTMIDGRDELTREPSRAPHWSTRLATHVVLTGAQVMALESLRERDLWYESALRMVVEEYPPFRRAYFRRVFEAVAVMTPGADEMFYATRMLGVFHEMNLLAERYMADVRSNAGSVLPSLDFPSKPPWPSNLSWCAIQSVTAKNGWTSMRALVEGVIADEAVTRAADPNPRQSAFVSAVFAILGTNAVPDAWPEWQ